MSKEEFSLILFKPGEHGVVNKRVVREQGSKKEVFWEGSWQKIEKIIIDHCCKYFFDDTMCPLYVFILFNSIERISGISEIDD